MARCADYGRPQRNAGPIYPDTETRNGGLCTPEGCFCVVRSDTSLPFFISVTQDRDRLCAVTGAGPAFDARGFCRFRPNAHGMLARRPPTRQIILRYAGVCEGCGGEMRVGSPALYADRPAPFQPTHLFHVEPCVPTHDFVERTDIVAEDQFYCGCGGWD